VLLGSTGLASALTSELIAAAKEEGALNSIALAEDWCGYGELIKGFEAKYGIEVIELNANARSFEQIAALQADKGKTPATGPDVVDITPAAAVQAKDEGLIQPYKVATWDTIPDIVKDADGHWYGDYFGVLAFEVNTEVVKKAPADWPDLRAADYANSVALAGDPKTSIQGIQGVFAAGLSAANADIDKAAEAGLKFFAELNAGGNFVPQVGGVASLLEGTTPIIVRWDYLALKDRDALNGKPPVAVVVPKTGVVGGAFVQAISAFAPHPNAAKLWMEYLYSDEGQLGWLKGYCHPVRFGDLVKNSKVPQELTDKLPPAEAYDAVFFPTSEQLDAVNTAITGQWDTAVGVEVAKQGGPSP
jgi:putative spermidine/putrescine transport system substrate-binding protein